MDPATPLEAWAREVERPDREISLARAALALARLEYPGLEPGPYLARLDAMAAAVAAGSAGRDAVGRLHRLREHLFAELRFRGNREHYFDPRNSFLNDVLDRRLGIPITLSLLLIDVGGRIGLAVEGIGLPGHFIAGVRLDGGTIYLDAFNGGRVLTEADCGEVVARALGRRVSLEPEHFAPMSGRQLLARMLNNLKGIYWRARAWDRVVAVEDRLLRLDPGAAGERRDRGSALVAGGEYGRGLADWERYLADRPDAPDHDEILGRLRRLRRRLAELN
jgi:regulator of sirC expression with transglutaminase-like and TPR domain